MATEFVLIIDPDSQTGFDHVSQGVAEGIVDGYDYTDTTGTMVFSGTGSGAQSPLEPGDTVVLYRGDAVLDPSITGTVIEVRAANDYILIGNISGTPSGGYQTDDEWRRAANDLWTYDGVTADSAIVVFECRCDSAGSATADTTYVSFDTSTTVDATNKFIVRAASGHKAECPISTTKYRHTVAGFGISISHIDIEEIQRDGGAGTAFGFSGENANYGWLIDECTIAQDTPGPWDYGINFSTSGSYTGTGYVRNCFIYGFSDASGFAIRLAGSGLTARLHANTLADCGYGIYIPSAGPTEYLRSNIIDCTVDASATFTAGRNDYNFVSDATPTTNINGSNGDYNVSFTYESGTDNYHIDATVAQTGDGGNDARDDGENLTSDGNLPVTVDFDGDTRDGYSAGADEVDTGAVEHNITGSADITVPEGDGGVLRKRGITGAADITVPLGAGDVSFTIPSHNITGSANIVVPLGAGDVEKEVVEHNITGSANLTVPLGAGDVSYLVEHNITGSATITVPEGDGGILREFVVVGAADIVVPEGSGDVASLVLHNITGSANITSPLGAGNVDRDHHIIGVGDIAVPSGAGDVSVTGTVFHTVTGSANIVVPEGNGGILRKFVVVGAADIAGPLGAGDVSYLVEHNVTGSANIVVPLGAGDVSVVGAVIHNITGSANIVVPLGDGGILRKRGITGAATVAVPVGAGDVSATGAAVSQLDRIENLLYILIAIKS